VGGGHRDRPGDCQRPPRRRLETILADLAQGPFDTACARLDAPRAKATTSLTWTGSEDGSSPEAAALPVMVDTPLDGD